MASLASEGHHKVILQERKQDSQIRFDVRLDLVQALKLNVCVVVKN